ncbi:uncharacterized protein LOC108915326 [Anoplophora glabripennis]|uniref:uncharacterized protein LOC108915326 n=1 Tax=Anoplophora glabripennis TaxID=217634 RepID=UPI0008746500|nr:uncharacterized protein LOC108915326 [Anoplophora glabripennis]
MVFVTIIVKCFCQDSYTAPNIKLRFPSATTMGIFIAIAFPIDLPHRDVYYSHFFEALHPLPSNETSFEYPPLIERDMDRQMVYKAFEKRIESNGYPGKPCLLRAICEMSLYSIKDINGVLGEIIHIIFTPSASKNFGLSSEYSTAERRGRNHDCSSYEKKCSISFVDLITWVEDTVDE